MCAAVNKLPGQKNTHNGSNGMFRIVTSRNRIKRMFSVANVDGEQYVETRRGSATRKSEAHDQKDITVDEICTLALVCQNGAELFKNRDEPHYDFQCMNPHPSQYIWLVNLWTETAHAHLFLC